MNSADAARLVDRYGIEDVVAALTPLLSEERRSRIDQVLGARLTGLTVVVENLYDPHNGAAAIRSLEALGVSSIHAVEESGNFRAASGVTKGCDKWVDIHTHRDVAGAVAALEGMTLCATVPGAAETLDDIPPLEPLAFWIGNEHQGLTEPAVAACTRHIQIPMFGFTQSFNLSVSVALLLARAAERRRAALGAPGDMPEAERAKRRARWYAQSIRGAEGIVARYVSERTQK